jgi:hypothetical protein
MLAALSRTFFPQTKPRRPAPSADRRSEPRMRALGNAYLRLGPRDVPLIDWSRGGFRAMDTGDFTVGQFARFRVHMRGIQDLHPPLLIRMDAVILRADGERIAGRWRPVNCLDDSTLAAFAGRKAADPLWLIPPRPRNRTA